MPRARAEQTREDVGQQGSPGPVAVSVASIQAAREEEAFQTLALILSEFKFPSDVPVGFDGPTGMTVGETPYRSAAGKSGFNPFLYVNKVESKGLGGKAITWLEFEQNMMNMVWVLRCIMDGNIDSPVKRLKQMAELVRKNGYKAGSTGATVRCEA